MYFRFPLLLILIGAFIAGFFYLTSRYFSSREVALNSSSSVEAQNHSAESNGHPDDVPRQPYQSGLESFKVSQLRAHLRFLSDDLLQGREAGSEGARLASSYIAAQFERIGLRPIGENGSFYQTVNLVKKSVRRESVLRIESGDQQAVLHFGEDFLLLESPPQERLEVSGELVFTGFGINAPEYNYNDFDSLDVKGKITIQMSGEPGSDDNNFFEGPSLTKYANGSFKTRTASEHGAAANIGILDPETLQKVSWPTLKSYFASPKFSLSEERGEKASYFPAIILHPNSAATILSGTQLTFEDVISGARNGGLRGLDLNKRIRFEIFSERKNVADRNVLGYLEGSDPQLKSEVVILTAHYDHEGIGTPAQGDSIYNGAADNASGVAGLIELAEAFSLLPERPKRSMLFMAVTAEEKGLLGSKYYVSNPIIPLKQTVANFNLDMMGVGDSTGIVAYGIERSDLGQAIREAAAQVQLNIIPDEMPDERIFYRSDHYSFAQAGIPAIYPSFGMTKANFSEFREYYHTPSDDFALPFNYAYIVKHLQVVFLASFKVANAAERPQWMRGDPLGAAGVPRD